MHEMHRATFIVGSNYMHALVASSITVEFVELFMIVFLSNDNIFTALITFYSISK